MTDETTSPYANSLSREFPDFDLADTEGTSSLGAWFLGPKGENKDLLTELISHVIGFHCEERANLYETDPEYVTPDIKASQEYQDSKRELRARLDWMLDRLRGSMPFFSYRYHGHMNWDVTLPAVVGYFAGMLHNQNNVAAEGGPVTSMLEVSAGEDLCRMLGYRFPEQGDTFPRPWGHITCDGSVANIEAMWSARNLRYYPISIARAIEREPALERAEHIEVSTPGGRRRRLLDLDAWQLVNLKVDEVLGLGARMVAECGIPRDALARITPYTLQAMGYEDFAREYLGDEVGPPAVLGPVNWHYSWPKAAALLGVGQRNLIDIGLDMDARARIDDLRRALEECAARRRPVLLQVAVMGSTEQSAVDPLAEMVALREEYHARDLAYSIHADAAWGGYFATMLQKIPLARREPFTPELTLNRYVTEQYEALPDVDSITVDPHKAGFVPYPAGALCYRNKAQRELVAFSAPYVVHDDKVDASVGFYGVEGSKPGAAAAAVFLSHQVIPADERGYGKILGKAMFNSKRLYAALVTMARDDDPFVIAPCQRLPVERTDPGDPEKLRRQLDHIRTEIVPKSNRELQADGELMALLEELGSDQVIIAYAFNFKVDGEPNPSTRRMNEFNKRLLKELGIEASEAVRPYTSATRMPPLIVTGSTFDPEYYSEEYLGRLRGLLGVRDEPGQPIEYLISTTMDPWVSDTAEGDLIPAIVADLHNVVSRVATHMELEENSAVPAQGGSPTDQPVTSRKS